MRTLLPLALLATAAPALAADPPSWTEPTAPFAITDNIYYVGAKGLAAYLVRTSDGLILIDGTMAENVPFIERNIAALGFRVQDIRVLLASHAHFDHAAGLAQLQRDSGARFLSSPGDARAYATGVPPSKVSYGVVPFPKVRVDGRLAEGRAVTLGGVRLTPVFTPGHTAGCTTWTMASPDGGMSRHVVFPCSMTVAGNQLVGNPGYKSIVTDFRRTFPKMAKLQADIVLPAHPEGADVLARGQRRAAGDKDAFVAPGLLQRLTEEARQAFEAELAKQQAAAAKPPSPRP